MIFFARLFFVYIILAVLSGNAFAQGVFYTPLQMKVIMEFKPVPLLSDDEREKLDIVLDNRENELNAMMEAIRKQDSLKYYINMKKLLLESTLLKKTVKSSKYRLQEALDDLDSEFSAFGDERKKWPPPAKAEEEKLKKGKEIDEKFLKNDDFFFKYIQARIRTTYEICVLDPETFSLNKVFLKTGINSAREFQKNYKKILDALKKADKKARSFERK